MNILTSFPLLLIDYRSDNNTELGTSPTATIIQFWIKHESKLVHHYSLVDYILSPNPTIMAHAIYNKTLEHDGAAEQLITMLLLDPALVRNKQNIERARLIDIFTEECGNFTNRRSVFAQDNIWIRAANEHCKVY
jgi:hypothetical protein